MGARKSGRATALAWLFLTTMNLGRATAYPTHQDGDEIPSAESRDPWAAAESGEEIVPPSAYQQHGLELMPDRKIDMNAFSDYLDLSLDAKNPDQEDCRRFIQACQKSHSEDICQRTYAICQAVCEIWQNPESDICQFVRNV